MNALSRAGVVPLSCRCGTRTMPDLSAARGNDRSRGSDFNSVRLLNGCPFPLLVRRGWGMLRLGIFAAVPPTRSSSRSAEEGMREWVNAQTIHGQAHGGTNESCADSS